MSSPQNTLPGIIFKSPDGRTYFIPQKVLNGFEIQDPAGKTVLEQLITAAPTPGLKLFRVYKPERTAIGSDDCLNGCGKAWQQSLAMRPEAVQFLDAEMLVCLPARQFGAIVTTGSGSHDE